MPSNCARVMLIRHAEKPGLDGRDSGLNAASQVDPGGLTVLGWQRVGALVGLFGSRHPAPEATVALRPATILAASDTAKSWRPRLTVEPLARSLGLAVDTRFGSQDDAGTVAAAVIACRGPVLVCWRHRALGPLARALAPGLVLPDEWPSDQYDVVWIIDREPGRWRFRQIPQRLLPHDRDRLAEHAQEGMSTPAVARSSRDAAPA